jgi:phosphate transport system substrate-binding protein
MGAITDVVKNNPVETVVVLFLGAILGGVIEKHVNKCECRETELAAMAVEAQGDTTPQPTTRSILEISLNNSLSSSDALLKVIKNEYSYCTTSYSLYDLKSYLKDATATNKALNNITLDPEKFCQFPIAHCRIVPVFNIPNIKSLNLSGGVLAQIFLGKINKWNDNAIKSLNPKLNLPNENITVVYRNGISGSKTAFQEYLKIFSKLGSFEKKKINCDTNIEICQTIKTVQHTISYVPYSYAIENSLCIINLKTGKKVIKPTLDNLNTEWPITGTYYIVITKSNNADALAEKFKDKLSNANYKTLYDPIVKKCNCVPLTEKERQSSIKTISTCFPPKN